MTGMMQALLGSRGFIPVGGTFASNVPATSAPYVSFNADGTVTNNAGFAGNWGEPTTAGGGAAFWIRVETGTGDGTPGGLFEQWLQLSATRSFSIAASSGEGPLPSDSRSMPYQIASSAGGTPVVGSGTINVLSEG